MANALQNTDLIVKGVIAEIKNQSVLFRNVTRDVDNVFDGNVGDTIRRRRPNKMKSVQGPDVTGLKQGIVDATVELTINQLPSVPVEISSFEKTFDLTDPRYKEEHLQPMAIELLQNLESFIANNYWQVANFAGTPGVTPDTTKSVGQAVNLLKNNGVNIMDRNIRGFFEPDSALCLSDAVQKNFFAPNVPIRALEEAIVNRITKADIFECNSIINHTVGQWGGVPLVNGAAQDVTYIAPYKNEWTQTIITDGWDIGITGLLLKGDVITFDGVNAVQAKTYQDLGRKQHFTVMEDVDSDGAGNAVITISPPMYASGPYQNVTAAPADDAAITVETGVAGGVYPQNLIFHKKAFLLAFVKPKQPKVLLRSQVTMDGISLSYTADGDILTFSDCERLDAWFGGTWQLKEWATRMTG